MPIYLDDEAVELPGDDLGTVLAAARERLEADGRVVVEVAMDGQTLSADDLEQQHQTPVPADSDVRLYTADPAALSIETLEQVRTALSGAADLQDQAADLLQQDQISEAMQKVAQVVEIWLQVQQAVLNAALLTSVDLDELKVDDQPLSAFTDDLVEKLNTLKETIHNQDTVGLADALGYEWPEVVDRWDRLVGELIARIQKK
ncbi:MAG: hypothetical protein ACODAQ_00465 [Phycisphaeraceae bacterium]